MILIEIWKSKCKRRVAWCCYFFSFLKYKFYVALECPLTCNLRGVCVCVCVCVSVWLVEVNSSWHSVKVFMGCQLCLSLILCFQIWISKFTVHKTLLRHYFGCFLECRLWFQGLGLSPGICLLISMSGDDDTGRSGSTLRGKLRSHYPAVCIVFSL